MKKPIIETTQKSLLNMNSLNSRVEIYDRISAKLSRLNDSQLSKLLDEGTLLHVGIDSSNLPTI